MIERTEGRFGIKPAYLAGDTAYGSADTLDWVVNEKKIEPHIPVNDKSKREDGTFSRENFRFDEERNIYVCPAGKVLTTTGHIGRDHGIRYYASLPDCRICMLKQKCCPNMPSRRIVRDVNEASRDVARALAKTEAFERSAPLSQTRRDAICSSQVHLPAWAASAARPMRRARRVHPRCNRTEFTPAFEAGCSTAASGRCMSCVVRNAGRCPLRASLLIKGRMVGNRSKKSRQRSYRSNRRLLQQNLPGPDIGAQNLRSEFSTNQFHRRDATSGHVLDHILHKVRCATAHQNVKPKRWWALGCRGFSAQLIILCQRKVTSVTFGNDYKADLL
jgi:hypothetical protein